jgi:hypothetical protein
MNMHALTKKRSILVIAIIAILAVSLITFFQTNKGAQAAVIDPHPGLVAWLRFDEGSGTIAGDSSGYGNNGTINGALWVPGQFDQALNFGGTSDYVQVPDSISLRDAGNNNRTIEFWAKFTSLSSSPNIIMMGLFETSSGGNHFFLYGNTVNFWTSSRTATDWQDYAANINFAEVLNGWHHFAMVYDGTHVYIYLDGNLKNSGILTGNWGNVPVIFKVDYNPLAFAGTIDEVRVYNHALSAADIQADFQQNPDFSSNLIAKVPKGTTQVMTTLSWQGTGSINVTIVSPSQTYTEDAVPVYQKTVYSTTGGSSAMLNIKRLSISVSALSADENWYVALTFDRPSAYQIAVEVQK